MDNNSNNEIILSEMVLEGLQYLCTEMSLDSAKKLIDNSISLTLHPDSNEASISDLCIETRKSSIVRRCEYSVVTLYALSTRHGLDSLELRRLLEDQEITQVIMDELICAYDKHRDDFILKQLHIGKYLPVINDVQWRILTDVKSSVSAPVENEREVHFNINLGEYTPTNGIRETIAEFICNTEEMQHFINNLKEIERHCNKIAHE